MTTDLDVQEVYDNFPFPDYRKYQEDKINEITEALNSGYKWIFLEAPTGFGKSAINVAFCESMDSSFYITPQNVLIDYLHSWYSQIDLIKGRRHYPCMESRRIVRKGKETGTHPYIENGKIKYALEEKEDKNWVKRCQCNVGICKKIDDYECLTRARNKCKYWKRKKECKRAKTALTNFAYFIGEGFIPEGASTPHFGDRELLVIDEGHNIDKHALNFISITLSKRTLPWTVYEELKPEIQDQKENEELSKVDLDGYIYAAESLCEDFLDGLDDESELDDTEIIAQNKAERTIRKVVRYKKTKEAEWLGQVTDKKTVKALPVYAHEFMEELLWRRADRFIISSATIFPKYFAPENNIPREEAKYITAPSTFPLRNRPIIDATAGSLSYKHKRENLPKVLKAVKKILHIEPGKGLIHAHGYNWSDKIKKGIHNLRLMFHNRKNREEILKKWLDSPPEDSRVLVGVAMTEGLDLRGDLCTFQVIFKCPYASMQDPVVGYRIDEKEEWNWYTTETMKTIIQAYGRAVRTKTDKARFYLVDSSTTRLLNQWKKRLPPFFRNAYNEMKFFDR